jgi:hypothetical protein
MRYLNYVLKNTKVLEKLRESEVMKILIIGLVFLISRQCKVMLLKDLIIQCYTNRLVEQKTIFRNITTFKN